MKHQKEWSSFRLTLLLYIIVLIIPTIFYFVYASFDNAKADTKVMHQTAWISGMSDTLLNTAPRKLDKKLIQKIDTNLKEISAWVMQNNDSKLYLGGQTLLKDLSDVNTCLNTYKQDQGSKCNKVISNFTLIVENMVYLKQKNLVNMFYWNLAVAMLVTLLLIYFVRVYIHKQMKKHSMHDHETHLFNKKYFLSELHSTFDRSVRHENPLSLISVSLNGFTDKTYDKKTKRNLMKELGELFTSVTRNSDIAARYDEGHIAVLLPLTDKAHAQILESRLKEALEKHNFKVSPKIDFDIVTTEAALDETEEAFIARTL